MLMKGSDMDLTYSIFDPTGNITALVETPVAVELQPEAAAGIMRRHREVEQVGFFRILEEDTAGAGPYAEGHRPVQAELRMAGGEFCGNASMSAAALYVLRQGGQCSRQQDRKAGSCGTEAEQEAERTIRLRVSGAAEPVEVRLSPAGAAAFRAAVRMPKARSIEKRELSFGALSGKLPVVFMEGISHIIIESGSPFFRLLSDRVAAEQAVRQWCAELQADGLGLMFLEAAEERSRREAPAGSPAGPAFPEESMQYRLTPLVYVPVGNTVFWENSCASGTSAAGMYLAQKTGAPAELTLREPGGLLRVESDPEKGETWLYGTAKLTQRARPGLSAP